MQLVGSPVLFIWENPSGLEPFFIVSMHRVVYEAFFCPRGTNHDFIVEIGRIFRLPLSPYWSIQIVVASSVCRIRCLSPIMPPADESSSAGNIKIPVSHVN
jgi:hypothetical protein